MSLHPVRLLLLLAALLLSAAPRTSAQNAPALSGRVVSSDTGEPVRDARVSLEGTTIVTITDATGRFLLAAVPPASYTLVVTRDGFASVRARVDVAAGSNQQLDVRLPLPAAIREDVTVGGRTVGELGLAGTSSTASRLGLRAIDIPASIDVLDSTVMEARGYQKVSDAVSRMAGVVAGEHPTAPSSFVVRGFTTTQVQTLRDGIWLGPSAMVMRPQNTFNLERVELLRGPSSVVNGQGAVAGTINAVTKRAEPTSATSWQGLLSYGRFGTYHAAAGVTGPVNGRLWYRVDVSRSGSDGYVERMDSGSSNVTGSLLWQPSPRVRVRFGADVLDDDLPKYFGTPLLPASAAVEPLDVIRAPTGETIDGRIRFVNYNVSDAYAQSRQVLLRSDVSWDVSDYLTVSNVVYGFDAARRWKNAEGYVFCGALVGVCTTVGDIQRYNGYFLIDHDQRLIGDRLTLNVNAPVRGRDNRGVVGVEASTLDFERTRGFRRFVPPTPGDAVDLLDPVPGVYGPEELRSISPTAIDTWALFLEDSFALTPRLRLAGGLRVDGLHLDRRNLSPTRVPEAGGFERQFTSWSWRAGAVYGLGRGVVAYGQFSNARDPVSANVFLVNANQNFDLTQAKQWEVGVKADLDSGRTQLTAAYFDIRRDDVLERFALDSVTNIGGIDSKGVELAGTVRLGEQARLGANLGYTRSAFRSSANFVQFAGHRPPNVPVVTTNLWASYQRIAGLPFEIGGSARFVGDRFANNANAIVLKRYGLLDAYVAWTRDRVRVTAKADNLADTAYASWSDVFYLGQTDPSFLYANQLMLGAPRTVSLQLQVGF
jgi:iron complex outermembrane recepter protein